MNVYNSRLNAFYLNYSTSPVFSDVWDSSVRMKASCSAAVLSVKDGIEAAPVAYIYVPSNWSLSSGFW